MGEEESKIRWETYVVAGFWAALLIGMAWVVPPFRDVFKEMRYFSTGVSVPQLPLMTRVVVGVPSALYVVMALVVAGTLIWKSKVLSRKAAHRVDLAAAGLCFIAGGFVVVALFLPLIELQ